MSSQPAKPTPTARILRWTPALLATTAICLALTGCNDKASGSHTPPPLTTQPQPRATPTATPSNPAQSAAGTEAMAAYRQFVAAVDTMAASGGKDVTALQRYASGAMLAAELNQAEIFKARNWHSVGQQKVVSVKVLSFGAPDANGRLNELILQACIDSSQASAVDAAGKSVKKPGTPTQAVEEMRMKRAQVGWQANFPQSLKGARCAS